MTQTYPTPITAAMCAKIDDGVARPIPAATYPGDATTTIAYEPSTYAEKTTNHPAGAPDFVLATLVNKASNMPYP
jgi:hypothetical protein